MLKSKIYGLLFLITVLTACGSGDTKKLNGESADSLNTQTLTEKKNILFFGNSLTAGLGVEPGEAFPAVIGNKIDSLNLPYRITNAGLSGETTAAGKARISWILKQKVDVFVLELGANDGLRGIPVAETRQNLQDIVDQVKAKYPEAKLIMTGMEVPPNMGNKYASEFRVIFAELAKKNNMALVPFLLDKVGGIPELNQNDGIHPTPEGHKILAENVWLVLKDLL
ncbi:arylesterase [Daejeonella sp. H1SJ63]|uniref:arylesterase n=1 Tax=Daejeonella sp. H1SJ63 TaxID=3034145 RepID=UPI0023ED40CA|nr:arylesterase [Daejeonella sp. H1SJ63]